MRWSATSRSPSASRNIPAPTISRSSSVRYLMPSRHRARWALASVRWGITCGRCRAGSLARAWRWTTTSPVAPRALREPRSPVPMAGTTKATPGLDAWSCRRFIVSHRTACCISRWRANIAAWMMGMRCEFVRGQSPISRMIAWSIPLS